MSVQAAAFGVSVLVHAAALSVVVALSGAAAPAGRSRVIDLRIVQSSGSEVVSLPERPATTPRPPPRQRKRRITAKPVIPRPRVEPTIEAPPLAAVPPPVPTDTVLPPAPAVQPASVEAPEPAAAPAVASEAGQPEVAPVAGTAAVADGGGEWPGAGTGETTFDVASADTAAVDAPAGETGPAGSSERVVASSGALPGEEPERAPRDFSALRELVQRHLVYPSVARRRGWEGKVTLSFVVGGNGRVREIAVLESSGRDLLDRHAVETVKKISSFPAAVAESLIIVPVVYRLY